MKKKVIVLYSIFITLFIILFITNMGLQTKKVAIEIEEVKAEKVKKKPLNPQTNQGSGETSWLIVLAQKAKNFFTSPNTKNTELSINPEPKIEDLLAQIPEGSLPIPRGISVVSMKEQENALLAQNKLLVEENFDSFSFNLSEEEMLDRIFSAYNLTDAEKKEIKEFVKDFANKNPSDISEEDKEKIKNFDSLSEKEKEELKKRILQILDNRVYAMTAQAKAGIEERKKKGYIEATDKELEKEIVPLNFLRSEKEVEVRFVPANVSAVSADLKSEGAISYDGAILTKVYSTPSGEKVQIVEWERGEYSGAQLLEENIMPESINGYPAVYVVKKNTGSGKEVQSLTFFSNKKTFVLKATGTRVDLAALARSIRD